MTCLTFMSSPLNTICDVAPVPKGQTRYNPRFKGEGHVNEKSIFELGGLILNLTVSYTRFAMKQMQTQKIMHVGKTTRCFGSPHGTLTFHEPLYTVHRLFAHID